MPQHIISTKNILLRSWQDSDTEPFILLNSDPDVMEFFPSVLQPAETIRQIERIQKHFADYGYGFLQLNEKTITSSLALPVFLILLLTVFLHPALKLAGGTANNPMDFRACNQNGLQSVAPAAQRRP